MRSENFTPEFIFFSILVLLTITSYLFIYTESGVNPPITIVESQSMQHSNYSKIGVIDTGDMIVVKNPDKATIISYVEGCSSNYSSFGDYGSVIIYNRPVGNPVIHRAILWLDYNEDGTWSAPTLKNYPEEKWNVENTISEKYEKYEKMTGTFELQINYQAGYSKKIPIDLSKLEKTSGYLTMGDNPQNDYFDQELIWANHLINKSDIRSIAWFELPWLGSIRLYFQGNVNVLNEWASNSILCLVTQIFVILISIAALEFIMNEIVLMCMKKKLRRTKIRKI